MTKLINKIIKEVIRNYIFGTNLIFAHEPGSAAISSFIFTIFNLVG